MIMDSLKDLKKLEDAMNGRIEHTNTIKLSVEEYARLKDIETRFTIIKQEMLHAEYCPIHTRIILGINKEYKEVELPLFIEKNFKTPDPDLGNQYMDDLK